MRCSTWHSLRARRWTVERMDWWTDEQTDRRTDRYVNGWTEEQTDRQTNIYELILMHRQTDGQQPNRLRGFLVGLEAATSWESLVFAVCLWSMDYKWSGSLGKVRVSKVLWPSGPLGSISDLSFLCNLWIFEAQGPFDPTNIFGIYGFMLNLWSNCGPVGGKRLARRRWKKCSKCD